MIVDVLRILSFSYNVVADARARHIYQTSETITIR